MARYTGPKVRVSRRLATNIFENEKGRKALERRPFPPGQHGRTRRRNAGSEYLAQLQEKQKAKYIYGVLERLVALLVLEDVGGEAARDAHLGSGVTSHD